MDRLRRTLSALPGPTPVADRIRQVPATAAPVSAADVMSMLRGYEGTHVVIEDHGRRERVLIEDPGRYELRIVPPAMVLRPDTRVDRQLEREHPGGLAIFDKEAIYAMAQREAPATIVGDAILPSSGHEMVGVTARELLEKLRHVTHPNISVFTHGPSYYSFVMPPLLIRDHSPLFADFYEAHQQQDQSASRE